MEEGIFPSIRTELRMTMAMMTIGFLLLAVPPLFLLWLPFVALALFLWAPANRWPALGGLLLLVSVWALLVPEVVAPTKEFPFFVGSSAGGLAILLSSLLLFPWFWRPMRNSSMELLFRGRGFASGAVRVGAIVSIANTLVLGVLLLL